MEDTRFTKVFVGGLAWETHRHSLRNYFQQFGDILEAVVITDKSTGRSKGYGFVTFRDAEAAQKACADTAPVIDGRRANCNLAAFGVQRSKPSSPNHAQAGRAMKVTSPFKARFGPAAAVPSPLPFSHFALPYTNLFGFSSYSMDYNYPASYYNIYGGAAAQHPMYGTGTMTGPAATAFYPYLPFAEGNGAVAGYASVHYPNQLFHYSPLTSSAGGNFPNHNGSPVSLAPSPTIPSVPQA